MISSFFVVLVAAAIGYSFFMLIRKFRYQQDNKDTESSSLSPPTSVPRIWKHNVFPSFHGADVRKNFLSHVLKSFKTKGIDSFIDTNIERSKSIGPELVEAIRGSKIAIVLLSRNYASSSWCLNELVEIMKCREVLGQIVIPIFYEVDPTDVKKQTRDFGKAFIKTCKGKTKEHIERWRKALEDVAQIEGEHSRNWSNEAAMIEKISSDISNMLNNSTPSRDFDGLVGMGAHMEQMEQLLRLDLVDEVRMIGIWGPPGIGKTTIARFMLNQVSNKFQHGAIMVNIKHVHQSLCLNDEYSAQLQLQQQMLSQIIDQKDIMVSHLGVAQEWLKHKKVFLVLDEVNHVSQLQALAEKTQWFGPGSRIIITTENRRVLKAHRINLIYQVNFPSNDEAFQIFCMHAFGQKHPEDGFHELARKVTYLAGKLPLGLKVLGSALRGMTKQEWERTLPRLENRLDGEIESIIKFSFDALCDEDKDLFIYIACLFINESTHKVEEVLAKKFPNVRQGLHVLAERSLISIDDEVMEMHTLLEQFGRETSSQQLVHHGLGTHRLLVGERDICELLSDDSTDGRRFIGMNFDITKAEEELHISEKSLERMSKLQFVRINGKTLDHPDRLPSLLCRSQKIKSLDWMHFQNTCLPSNFNPEFLVKLDMKHSELQKLWEGTKPLKNLKWMNLEFSTSLKELPDFSTATNLEDLDLESCSSLVKLPSSIGNATSLKDIYLCDCSNLVELPSFGNATKLEHLNLVNCSSLVKVPSSITATNLKILNLNGCSRVVELPAMENATNLETLSLHNCSSLVELPPSIGSAINLQYLDISGCSSLVKVPSSIADITNLKVFDLSNCSSLLKLPTFIVTNLQFLGISGCSSLVKLPSFIGYFTNLEEFYLRDCSSLVELPPSIGTATNLQKLDISGCSSLVRLPPSIGNLTNLEELILDDCSSLVELPSSIGGIISLRKLYLSNCSSLLELPSSIGNLQQLNELKMHGCSKLEALPTNINLESLDTLDLTDCLQLKRFPEVSTNIKDLNLIGTAIKEVPLSIMSWSRLSDFSMSYFESLKDYPHAHDIITELHLKKDIQEVAPWVKRISRLHSLNLPDCNNLVSLPQFSDSLSYLDARNCKSLERLDCSFNNPKIHLYFTNCIKLNPEARDLIMHTSTRGGSAILPGSQVPVCFEYQASGGSSLTIKLNERHLSTFFIRFKGCAVLVMDNEETGDDETRTRVDIEFIKQNNIKDSYEPVTCHIDLLLTEHIHTFTFEAWEVTSPELYLKFITGNIKWKIKDYGVLHILEDPSC